MPEINIARPRESYLLPHDLGRPPLKADRSLSYREFIRLIKNLWEEQAPDVPMLASQNNKFATYPVIVYAIEDKTAFQDESKYRQREHVRTFDDEDYIIWGKRFKNLVSFTVVTENDPELADQIIESFEDMMDQNQGIIKRLGASELLYGRRLPDDDRSRVSEDVNTRTVIYMFVEEKLKQVSEKKLEEILVRARVFVNNYGWNFTTSDGDTAIAVPGHAMRVGDRIIIQMPDNVVDTGLPTQLHHNWVYEIIEINEDMITIATLTGSIVGPYDKGVGYVSIYQQYFSDGGELEDNLQTGATPRYYYYGGGPLSGGGPSGGSPSGGGGGWLSGPAGPQGDPGPPGPGVPAGGSTGDIATKASGADYDIAWQTPAPNDRITSGSNELVIDADKIEGNVTSTSGGVGQLIINPGDADNASFMLDETAGFAGFVVNCTVDSRAWMVVASDGSVGLLGQGDGKIAGLTVSEDVKGLYFLTSDGDRSLIIGSVANNPSADDGSLLLDEVVGPHWRKAGVWTPIGDTSYRKNFLLGGM